MRVLALKRKVNYCYRYVAQCSSKRWGNRNEVACAENEGWIYADGAPGGHRDHRNLGGYVVASFGGGRGMPSDVYR